MKTIRIQVPRKYVGVVHKLYKDRGFLFIDDENHTSVEWAEYTFRRQKQANGYVTTMSAVFIPQLGAVVFGASACAPEDVPYFEPKQSAAVSLGRARQQAFNFLVTQTTLKSLIGPEGTGMLFGMDESLFAHTANLFAKSVAANAEFSVVCHAIRKLQKKHKTVNIVEAAKHEQMLVAFIPKQ